MITVALFRDEPTQQTVLITGAAGFIGFHMSRRLLTTKPLYRLVGLDNFDPYYDVSLKQNRVNLLRQDGMKFHKGDVCEERLLRHILSEYHVTMVIHFAAQAGVRHSVNDPLSYIRSNVECFVMLLDTLQHYQVIYTLTIIMPSHCCYRVYDCCMHHRQVFMVGTLPYHSLPNKPRVTLETSMQLRNYPMKCLPTHTVVSMG